MAEQIVPPNGLPPSLEVSAPAATTRLRVEIGSKLASQIDPQLIKKFNSSRTSHYQRSIINHYKDSTVPIITARELRDRYGWTNEGMYDTWIEQLPQRCPCPDWCDNLLIDLPWDQISIDIIDPGLPPIWGPRYNTQFMYGPCNSKKSRLTRAEFIQMRAAELARAELARASKPVFWIPAWPPPVLGVPISPALPPPLILVQFDRCESINRKQHKTTKTNPARTRQPSTWRCVLEAGHEGMHHASPAAHQAPWYDPPPLPGF